MIFHPLQQWFCIFVLIPCVNLVAFLVSSPLAVTPPSLSHFFSYFGYFVILIISIMIILGIQLLFCLIWVVSNLSNSSVVI